jgi:putative methyltransferase (TIGR01177 family)
MALVRMQDSSATFEHPEERVLIASSRADTDSVAGRIAFTKRVGELVQGGRLDGDQLESLSKETFRVTVFELDDRRADSAGMVTDYAGQIRGRVDLKNPDRELTIVRGERDYVALSRPGLMKQTWVSRRPRARPFFHPAAMFPKLSRALVNLSRVGPGEVFLDPFCGTGSLLLEAHELGALPVGADRDQRMTRGALKNMASFGQKWLGVVRADVGRAPLSGVDGIATDIPYGRTSSVSGSNASAIMENLRSTASQMLGEGKRLVAMHPKTVAVGSGSDFVVEEEHDIYIHRKLTRTISVLRRV